jgi:hypothetical protein
MNGRGTHQQHIFMKNQLLCNIKLRGLSPQANYSDSHLLAKLEQTFADRGCRVVSTTDPHARILGFLDRS